MSDSASGASPGHAFISYVREDSEHVDRLVEALHDAGIKVWRDKNDIAPGADWKAEIKRAITDGALVFIACFSSNYERREKTYQNEELILAAEQIRLRPMGHTWYVPVRFDECKTPQYDIGAGRDLTSIQHLDLFEKDWEKSVRRLVAVAAKALRVSTPAVPSPRTREHVAGSSTSTSPQGQLLVVRPWRFLGAVQDYDVSVNDVKVGTIANGQRKLFEVPVGLASVAVELRIEIYHSYGQGGRDPSGKWKTEKSLKVQVTINSQLTPVVRATSSMLTGMTATYVESVDPAVARARAGR